jgi:hypothetical protein
MTHKRRKKAKKSKKAAKAKAAEGEQKSTFPRLEWSRSPVQRPHSTPKGLKGYDRKRAKKELRKGLEE